MRSLEIQLHACVACGQHHRQQDRECPHCGHTRADGSVRTAAAMILGLAMLTPAIMTGCGDDTSGSGGSGGDGGATTTTQSASQSTTDMQAVSTYGVGPTSDASTGVGGAGGGQ